MFGINFNAAEEAAKSLRTATADLRSQRSKLQALKDSLHAQREALYLQALSKADAKLFLFDYIDAWAEQYLARGVLDDLFQMIAAPNRDKTFAEANNLTVPYLCLRDVETVLYSGEMPKGQSIFKAFPLPIFGDGIAMMNASHIGAACFFFGDLVKAKLEQYFDAKYPEPNPDVVGAPMAERRALIQELDRQIGELDSGINQIDARLRQLGVREPRRLLGGE
ncbi:TPA: hypothetical protein ACHY13_004990 [Pseudomonas aeruginosa]|uniref:hypothetical protein n=1 Tax=Pseudomonas aeruginosa TaxID=287 RepID=UPI002928AB6C|nr:hypothetical protein [Pseudomonas aeruginosa]